MKTLPNIQTNLIIVCWRIQGWFYSEYDIILCHTNNTISWK